MPNASTKDRFAMASGLSLCRHMLAGLFDTLHVRVHEGDDVADQQVHWALGLLADGQSEVLDMWLASASEADDWRPLLDDLRRRGLERLRFVVIGAGMKMADDACTVFPGATVLPSIAQLVSQSLREVIPRDRGLVGHVLERVRNADSAEEAMEMLAATVVSAEGAGCSGAVEGWLDALERWRPLYALGARQRGIVTSGDNLVRSLHLSLSRAVKRHGVFSDREAVIEFVGRALLRAERGFAAGAKPSDVRAVQAERSGSCYGLQPMSV